MGKFCKCVAATVVVSRCAAGRIEALRALSAVQPGVVYRPVALTSRSPRSSRNHVLLALSMNLIDMRDCLTVAGSGTAPTAPATAAPVPDTECLAH